MFFKKLILPVFLIIFTHTAFTGENPAAGISDGENIFFYETLHEAFEEAAKPDFKNVDETIPSIENPVEITLLADVTLDEPLVISDGVHIRLVSEGADRFIHRSENNLDYPVIWVRGTASSVTLGKPGMETLLIIDGGYIEGNETSIQAHAPIAAVSGPDSKLIMYDNVILQNNCNVGNNPSASFYQLSGGVFVRTSTTNSDLEAIDHLAEFIMRGGIIRGNINDTQNLLPNGGGVTASGFSIFTMEGGVIMNNTATGVGGGFVAGSRASFYKTGGIIYGSNAPKGYRNTALGHLSQPKIFGHAVVVCIFDPVYKFRNDTVKENDNLSYTGTAIGNGTFNKGDKWDDPAKAARRGILIVILAALAAGITVFFIIRKIIKTQKIKKAKDAKTALDMELKKLKLSSREIEVCKLLLTELSLKEISYNLGITYSGVNFHAQNVYRKLNIQSRTELFVKFGGLNENEK